MRRAVWKPGRMCILFRGDVMESIWQKSVQMPAFPQLEGELDTDVLIVGGGLAGILTAHKLSKSGVRCALIERTKICSGMTARTTAKVTSQHGLVYARLLKKFGREKARLYWEANEGAIEEIRELSEGLDCDFQNRDHIVYGTKSLAPLEEEMAALDILGIPYNCPEALPLPVPVRGAIRFRNQAQFHPLKFAAEICRGLEIYENTPARSFAGNAVITDRGRIRASRIIIATHFPILNKHGGYFLRMHQQRSYVLALEKAMDVEGMYLAAEEDGFSLRNHGDSLLIGQGGHRTGKKSSGWKLLDDFASGCFPEAMVAARWANQDCMTLDGLPYIGPYSRSTPDLFVATGFNKWGMTHSMTAATVLSALVQGKEDPYDGLFSPQRSSMHPQLIGNAAEATLNLLTPTVPRCPHLGCALKWNPHERSWDCPCHGSRFDSDGKLLNGPATGDLPKK